MLYMRNKTGKNTRLRRGRETQKLFLKSQFGLLINAGRALYANIFIGGQK
jgi:hypothetical protein